MRSWISPSTDTATAAMSRRSPIVRTTSAGSVPAGTVRVAPSGSTRVSSEPAAAEAESGRSIMLRWNGWTSGDEWLEQPGVDEVQHEPGDDGRGDQAPHQGAPDRHVGRTRRSLVRVAEKAGKTHGSTPFVREVVRPSSCTAHPGDRLHACADSSRNDLS